MADHDPRHNQPFAGRPAPQPGCADLTNVFAGPDPVVAASAAAPAAPARLKAGRYEVLDEIARGGMGVVYRAHDPAVNRDVAVKVLQERFRGRPVATRRFVEEGQITGQFQHPGVPAVHEIGALPDGSPFLAM